ncbi:hypothetical protein [Haliscomenobacter sp.]|uniref:hypothetical protein n=1 Tax=Haliscomenobacter sp. TaxID=2717303 RepID=UPI003BAA8E08
MNSEYNKRLISLWAIEVETLLEDFKIPLEAGKFTLLSCSAEEILFRNMHVTLIFCYEYGRYHTPVDHMTFDRVELQMRDGQRYRVIDLIKRENEEFDIYEYLSNNLKERIYPRQSYCRLIETYFLEEIQNGFGN